jgi:hypothetical protein
MIIEFDHLSQTLLITILSVRMVFLDWFVLADASADLWVSDEGEMDEVLRSFI